MISFLGVEKIEALSAASDVYRTFPVQQRALVAAGGTADRRVNHCIEQIWVLKIRKYQELTYS